MKADTLIFGYGNADRQDDGAGWHIVKILAERLGLSIPEDPGAAIELEDELVDLIFDLQIYPELAETISQYKRVCFVDAHTSNVPEEISWVELSPAYEISPLTHHMSPKTVLSISQTVYDKAPETILVSVRGYKFQFERELSPQTEQLTHKAAERIWQWVQQEFSA
ncbi:MAG: hydrogenase maturation protease [Chloroflexota bacterium]|nr:hydrogenase maturation protease [Chloroflexota bacterium]